jgi:hypothetical protein
MANTPTWDIPLPADGQSPWGADYRQAMTIIDERLGGLRGSLFVDNNQTPTVITTQNVPVPAVLGNVESGPPCKFCAVNGAGVITYLGPLDRVPTVQAAFTLQSAGGNKTFRVEIRKNGLPVAGSAKRVRFGPNVTVQNGALVANVEISTGDQLQLWVSNLTDTTDLTVLDLTLAARG